MALSEAQARRIITQEAFSVAPQLLGLPLAGPGRRLTAILLDLLIVSILVSSGAFVFGLAVAFVFFRFAQKALGRGDRLVSRTARIAFRVTGSIILFACALTAWDWARDRLFGEGRGERAAAGAAAGAAVAEAAGGPATLVGAMRMVGEVAALQNADDEEEAREAAVRLVARMRELGVPEAEIRATVEKTAREAADEKPWMPGAVAPALAGLPAGPAPLAADSLAVLYAAAARGGDTARADTLGARLGSVLARDSLDQLRAEVGELGDDLGEARGELEEERESGLLSGLLRVLDDLGIGFGWTGLYFTAFTALWRGQTPGKKLLGIRVLRLNGQPMTLWMSFERFGGYAAGLLTGLLGFAQVYWDRNRQMIHDKITETVVIRERAGVPVPGAAAAPPARPAPARSVGVGPGAASFRPGPPPASPPASPPPANPPAAPTPPPSS
jgi:uncharacterized RDD family membrane protein YckC